MRKGIISALGVALLVLALPVGASAQELALGGQPVGIELATDGVVVAGFSELCDGDLERSPAREAGLREGDRIVQIGASEISCAQDFIDAVAALEGKSAALTVVRGEKELHIAVQPLQNAEGKWMLGVWLRDQSAGIGTLTFYDPATGIYGALGHGVTDENNGEALPIRGGRITEAQIVKVLPGSRGVPGELSGCADRERVLGEVSKNCDKGVYGSAGAELGEGRAAVGSARPGSAQILTTLEGRQAHSYAVEISRVYIENGAKRMLLTVTDPVLQELSGGIVQGMSGSPILQEGKLVGAVTHVLVSDPCRGYGISIQDMLGEAGIDWEEQAA